MFESQLSEFVGRFRVELEVEAVQTEEVAECCVGLDAERVEEVGGGERAGGLLSGADEDPEVFGLEKSGCLGLTANLRPHPCGFQRLQRSPPSPTDPPRIPIQVTGTQVLQNVQQQISRQYCPVESRQPGSLARRERGGGRTAFAH